MGYNTQKTTSDAERKKNTNYLFWDNVLFGDGQDDSANVTEDIVQSAIQQSAWTDGFDF